ncbi:MAG: indole-3-glycerol phosphate synthase TrpC [Acidobacteriota bacterium]
MTGSVPDILARIVEHKRRELAAAEVSREALERRAEGIERRDFRQPLSGRGTAIIAEIKKASPSKGVLMDQFDPPAIARAYERAGAAALSVLTDEQFFQGSLADLRAARDAGGLPVLRKDFTIDDYQVAEAAAHGADAILLIAAILPRERLAQLREYAARFGMAALVEVHDEEELEAALDAGADLVGVNNRDLRTFEVTLETSLRLAARIPAGVVKVSESGIHSAEDIRRLGEAGYHAFLVGEHLMKSPDPAAALRALLV